MSDHCTPPPATDCPQPAPPVDVAKRPRRILILWSVALGVLCALSGGCGEVARESRRIHAVMQDCAIRMPVHPEASAGLEWVGSGGMKPEITLSDTVALYEASATLLRRKPISLWTKLAGKGPSLVMIAARRWFAVTRGDPRKARPREIVWMSGGFSGKMSVRMHFHSLAGGRALMILWAVPRIETIPEHLRKHPDLEGFGCLVVRQWEIRTLPGAKMVVGVLFDENGAVSAELRGRALQQFIQEQGVDPREGIETEPWPSGGTSKAPPAVPSRADGCRHLRLETDVTDTT